MLTIVLGIEDDIDIVAQAVNGVDAIELARETQPDVILLDVAMPVMDGIEALPHIIKSAPAATVVMLSGFASEQVMVEALAAGAWKFVEKGTEIRAIAQYVRDAAQVVA